MKIIYIANVRLPTKKAHGVQIVNTCAALSKAGAEVVLVTPSDSNNQLSGDVFGYYDVPRSFSIKTIWHPNFIFLGRIGFYLNFLVFNFLVCSWFIFKKIFHREKLIIYTRGEPIIFLGPILGYFYPVYWESHERPKDNLSSLYKRACQKVRGVVTVTKYYRDEILRDLKFSPKVVCAPDGVDIARFDLNITQIEARQKMNLPIDKKIIAYCGSFFLYNWKGVDVLLDSRKYLNEDYVDLLIGGTEEEIKRRGYDLNNVIVVPSVRNSLIPLYLKCADVLVLPNKKGPLVSEFYTSPVKLFEYMASRVPIVASNLRSIREVLNDNNSLLFESDKAESLALNIEKVLTNPALAQKISNQAFKDVHQYDWKKRAASIIKFISHNENF
jgi:glycosyltransferase involved in cell wall biosynthesis